MHRNKSKRYQHLEEFKSWRITKVGYWLLISAALFYVLSLSIVGAFVVVGVSYPLYILLRNTYSYIQGMPAQTSKASQEKKELLREIVIVFLMMVVATLLIGIFIRH